MPFNQREVGLINHPFFQRLRLVSQLGFASLVFPGATHTRFAHSLGVAHLAGKVFDQIRQGQLFDLQQAYSAEQLAYARQILRFAALAHDLGHPPFSHAAESILPTCASLGLPLALGISPESQASHEDFSYAIVYRLAKLGVFEEDEANDIVAILSKRLKPSAKLDPKAGFPSIFALLCQLINGEVDVDRMDYLHRDAYFAGVPYGRFDMERLVRAFSIAPVENRMLLAIRQEDVPTYENFLLSRIHMFHQIYFHKTLGAFSYYLRQAFVEKELDFSITGDLDEFVHCHEASLRESLNRGADRKWSRLIVQRKRAKTLLRLSDESEPGQEKLDWLSQILDAAGVPFFISRSSNRYTSQIRSAKIGPETVMVIQSEFGQKKLVPLADCSPLLESPVKRQIMITQLYVLEDQINQANQAIQKGLNDTNT